jgi:hypothetical protein
MVLHTCNPTYSGGGGKKIKVRGQVQGQPQAEVVDPTWNKLKQ